MKKPSRKKPSRNRPGIRRRSGLDVVNSSNARESKISPSIESSKPSPLGSLAPAHTRVSLARAPATPSQVFESLSPIADLALELPYAPSIVSCRELALLCATDSSYMFRILSGERKPGYQLALKMALILRVPGTQAQPNATVYRLIRTLASGDLSLLRLSPIYSPITVHMYQGRSGGGGKRAATLRAEAEIERLRLEAER